MIDTPLDAIEWCKQKSKRVLIGHDDYLDIANVIRALVQDRVAVQSEVRRMEQVIYKLEHPPKPKSKIKADPQPFGTEGNGIMTFQIPPDERK